MFDDVSYQLGRKIKTQEYCLKVDVKTRLAGKGGEEVQQSPKLDQSEDLTGWEGEGWGEVNKRTRDG